MTYSESHEDTVPSVLRDFIQLLKSVYVDWILTFKTASSSNKVQSTEVEKEVGYGVLPVLK